MKAVFILLGMMWTGLTFAQKSKEQPKEGDIIVINSGDASKYLGKTVSICDVIHSGKDLDIKSNADPTTLYIGGDISKDYFLLVIRKNDRSAFTYNPDEKLVNKKYCVTGKMLRYKGKPAIFVTDEKQLVVQAE